MGRLIKSGSHTHAHDRRHTHTGEHSQSTGDTHLSWAMQLFNQKTEIKMHSIKICECAKKTFPHFAWQRRQRRRRRRQRRQLRLRRRQRRRFRTHTRKHRANKRQAAIAIYINAEKIKQNAGDWCRRWICVKSTKKGHTAYT